MMKRTVMMALAAVALLVSPAAKAQERLPEYLQAEKFTQSKLNTMLFSTTVDPHWFQQGNNFWYTYKTSEGTFWYVVNPTARTKNLLFDREEMASQLTEIVGDPFEARQLPIRNLKAMEDGRTVFGIQLSGFAMLTLIGSYSCGQLTAFNSEVKRIFSVME